MESVKTVQNGLIDLLCHEEDKVPVQSLAGILKGFCNIQPQLLAIETTKILKTLRLIREECIESKDKNLKSLGNIAYKLYLFWKYQIVNEQLKSSTQQMKEPKSPRKKELKISTVKIKKLPIKRARISPRKPLETSVRTCIIAEPELQRKACVTIKKILRENNFDEILSEQIAVDIEANLRKKDPTMKSQYRRLFKAMLRDIKQLSKEDYNKFHNL